MRQRKLIAGAAPSAWCRRRGEMVCAENNGDHFGKNLFPIPQADRPDF
jgi:hypothetical protein